MIPLFKPFLAPKEEIFARLGDVFDSGYIAQGDVVEMFEGRFGKLLQVTFPVVATSSCTAALHIALILAGVNGKEVISTPMTAEPTNLAILHAGGKIVWADVSPYTGNIDPQSVASKITSKTRAIMAVNYAGMPAPMKRLGKIAGDNGLSLIEDAAHCWAYPSSWADYIAYSFQAIKFLTSGDGGALVFHTSSSDVQRAQEIRWFGIDRNASRTEMDISEVGYKYNMNNITAAIGLANLDHIVRVAERHVANGQYFNFRLAGTFYASPAPSSILSSYWLYTLLSKRRDSLREYLREHGIACGRVHRRNDLHTVFAESRTDLPGLDEFYSKMLHIPCGWWVSDTDREYIVTTIKKWAYDQ